MKKIIYLLIALLMIPFCVYATENKTIDVSVGSVEEDSNIKNVDVTWDRLSFTYIVENNYKWDNITHKYIKEEHKGYWSSNKSNISIANNSNKGINVKATFKSIISSISGSFSPANVSINPHTKKRLVFSLNGSLSSNYYMFTNAGSITLEFR